MVSSAIDVWNFAWQCFRSTKKDEKFEIEILILVKIKYFGLHMFFPLDRRNTNTKYRKVASTNARY